MLTTCAPDPRWSALQVCRAWVAEQPELPFWHRPEWIEQFTTYLRAMRAIGLDESVSWPQRELAVAFYFVDVANLIPHLPADVVQEFVPTSDCFDFIARSVDRFRARLAKFDQAIRERRSATLH
jgi:hypothetical protein